jgi:ABC-type transporter Mla MlaB component
MTNSNGNNSDRLNQIENVLNRLTVGLEETRAIANSNSLTIQGILEQQATDRLKREEEKAEHQEQMAAMRDAIQRLVRVDQGLANMVASVDENQPTILRKLTAIENKVDSLIERNQ